MRTDKTALEKLHSQAVEVGQRQAGELAQTQDHYRAALRLLNELQGHVISYQQRQHIMSDGHLAWGESRAMHSFIATLKAAVSAQRAEVNRLQTLLDEQTKAWTATRQRAKALEMLLDKRQAKARAAARAREQAELDDWLLHQASQRAA